jgi:hypothetical protein
VLCLAATLPCPAAFPCRGSKGGSSNLGGFANVKSFSTLQTAMYYIAGSPLVYDSSNPQHTPGRVSYIGAANDQKLCSTW